MTHRNYRDKLILKLAKTLCKWRHDKYQPLNRWEVLTPEAQAAYIGQAEDAFKVFEQYTNYSIKDYNSL